MGGSRSAMMGGTALILTARKIREMVVKEHGKYNPDLLLSGNYEAMEFYHHDTPLNSFGANLIRARVDNLGGHVEIEDCISYYDVGGKALSRENVIGQVQGGCAQGIGQTLYEEVAFDEEGGQLITASISDAGVPYASLLPRFKVLLAENPSELPSHAKGVGESRP
ncbi:molybdopterin-dependent oxidoreductase [Thermogymnomonas acidicola]|uniref:molybdopterin cofactor-binding domain-containing protein n=1 Tax=Thermogymnomonas acidicola TaxID=399579 RepID=UPI00094643B6|nr:molybdopterin cofactor-binding domain-containing protein [Thermogymnomonas acidicola]